MRVRVLRQALMLVAGALSAQEPDRVQKLLEEIEATAASEPPLLGIDTQLRAVALLQAKRPADAKRIAGDAKARIGTIQDIRTRAYFAEMAAKQLGHLDPTLGEELCQTLPRRDARVKATDQLSRCYGRLLETAKAGERRNALVKRALAAGAYDAAAEARWAEDAATRGEIFAAQIDGLPADATPAEIRDLLVLVRKFGRQEPALARQALQAALRAATSENLPSGNTKERVTHTLGAKKVETGSVRDALLLEIAGLAAVAAPDLYNGTQDALSRWKSAVGQPTWGDWEKYSSEDDKPARKPSEVDEEGDPPKGFAELPLAEAIAMARREKRPLARTAMLLQVVDDRELPPERAAVYASEALEATPKIADPGSRLMAQSMLTRRLYQFGDKQRAAVGAQMLKESFTELCRCETPECDVLPENDDLIPGSLVNDFAEYLVEHQITADDLGVRHPSLRVRLQLLELEEAINGKSPKKGIFP